MADAAGGGTQNEVDGSGMTAGGEVETEGETEVARQPAAMWAGMDLKSGSGWSVEVDA